MTTPDDRDIERARTLMMAVVDGECTDAERKELEALIATRPELGDEWGRLRRLKEVTVTMGLRQPPQEVWDSYRTSVLHRNERSAGWILLVLGAAVLAIGALWRALAALLAGWSDIPLEVRIGGSALAAGALLLIVSILRERWTLARRDPYSKEITR